jgi:hypothetical protein
MLLLDRERRVTIVHEGIHHGRAAEQIVIYLAVKEAYSTQRNSDCSNLIIETVY